jgi:putative SOS response-associated peptidase YedK
MVAAVANDAPDELRPMRWGLIPAWAKDPAIGDHLINARVETVAEKPAFRAALRRRRCLVFADGFYEWRKTAGGKVPTYVRLRSGAPFAFAGLWERWAGTGEPLTTCTLITGPPNELMAPIHNRMPVILLPEEYDAWLAPGDVPAERLLPLLNPYPAALMEAYAVSTRVNSPRSDGPELIAALGHSQ